MWMSLARAARGVLPQPVDDVDDAGRWRRTGGALAQIHPAARDVALMPWAPLVWASFDQGPRLAELDQVAPTSAGLATTRRDFFPADFPHSRRKGWSYHHLAQAHLDRQHPEKRVAYGPTTSPVTTREVDLQRIDTQ